MAANSRDLVAGIVFAGIGAFFAVSSLATLAIGEAFEMGPGYFPLMLGALLFGLGLLICLAALGRENQDFGPIPWRGGALVIASIVFFGVAVRGLGFAPTLLGASFMAAMASGRLKWQGAAIVALALTAFCVGVFVYALGLPYPIIGEWITG